MEKIGSLGKSIIFSTSDEKIFTFDSFQQNVEGRWATHERILKKPRSEFLGPGLRKVSFTIHLDARHGVKPRTMLEVIEKMVESGRAEKLIINKRSVGKYKWVITSISESWDVILKKGELLRASVSLSLEEYL